MLPEIVLPETEPETEWIRGRAIQKVSSKRDHSRLQAEFVGALLPWSRGRGEAGPEWRFRIEPPGEARRPLVPDIAYVRNERLRALSHDDLQAPALAPDVAIEILSPTDRASDVSAKIDDYLRSGTLLAIVVDPRSRTIRLHDVRTGTVVLHGDDVLSHGALPGFTLEVGAFFSIALDRAP